MKKTRRSVSMLLMLTMLMTSLTLVSFSTSAAEGDISTFSDLKNMVDYGTYRLTANITVTESIGSKFGITLDGQGHTITLTSGVKRGLIEKTTDCVLKNFILSADSEIEFTGAGSDGVGSVVCDATDTIIENVTNNVNLRVTAVKSWFGGIVGNMKGASTVKGCINNGNITAPCGEYVGGIVGVTHSGTQKIENCINNGNITSTLASGGNYVGGILGWAYKPKTTISGCENNGIIVNTANGDFNDIIGSGKNNCTIKNTTETCHVTQGTIDKIKSNAKIELDEDITVNSSIGYVSNVVFNGNGHTVTLGSGVDFGMFTEVGGTSVFKNLKLAGNITTSVSGDNYGSLMGASANGSNITVENVISEVNAKVTATRLYGISNFVGSAYGTVSFADCINKGPVEMTMGGYIGGFVGVAFGTVSLTGCINDGTIKGGSNSSETAMGSRVGGFAGQTYGGTVRFKNCINNGSVSGKDVGWLIGLANVSGGRVLGVDNCINLSDVKNVSGDTIDASAYTDGYTAISNASGLSSIQANKKYVLTANITASAGLILPDGVILNGNGYTVTLTSGAKSALFSSATNATLSNLTVNGTINVSGNSYEGIAGVIGASMGALTVYNVTSNVNINITNTNSGAAKGIGGIVGTLNGALGDNDKLRVLGCTNNGDIVINGHAENVGGIIGGVRPDQRPYEEIWIRGCDNNGDITITSSDNWWRGGIMGAASGCPVVIENSKNIGNLTNATEGKGYYGGIVGVTASATRIDNCVNYGAVNGGVSSGIVSFVSGSGYTLTVNECKNFGTYSTSADAVHGIYAAKNSATVTATNCYNATDDFTVKAAALELSRDIAVYFYVPFSAVDGAEVKTTATFCGRNVKAELVSETRDINGTKCVAFRVANISPAYMDENIDFTLFATKYGSFYNCSKIYSVLDYCDAMKNSEYVSVRRLCADLLVYGAASQEYIGDTSLVTEGLEEFINANKTSVDPIVSKDITQTKGGDGSVVWNSVLVTLGEKINPVFSFKASSTSGLSATVTYGQGKTATITEFNYVREGVYSLKFSQWSVTDFESDVSVVINSGDTQKSNTMNFSLEGYSKLMIQKSQHGDEKYSNIAMAMMKYIQSVNNYVRETV